MYGKTPRSIHFKHGFLTANRTRHRQVSKKRGYKDTASLFIFCLFGIDSPSGNKVSLAWWIRHRIPNPTAPKGWSFNGRRLIASIIMELLNKGLPCLYLILLKENSPSSLLKSLIQVSALIPLEMLMRVGRVSSILDDTYVATCSLQINHLKDLYPFKRKKVHF